MSFSLGNTSRANLSGVSPRLVSVVTRAIETTGQDFTVFEGVRSVERQRALVAAGASKTMRSRHIRQADGFGHAVDLVPWIDGVARWEWGPLYEIARAMRLAALERGVADLHWGGVWDRPLVELPADVKGIQAAVSAYCARHPGPDFIDGPHFQLGA